MKRNITLNDIMMKKDMNTNDKRYPNDYKNDEYRR